MRTVSSQFEAHRIIDAAKNDAILLANGYRPKYTAPTAKNRKRITVMVSNGVSFPTMVTELERLTAHFDDPVIYTGGVHSEEHSYGSCLIRGWAEYNHYQIYHFLKARNRDEKFCNLCEYLAVFTTGENDFDDLINLAKEENLRVKVLQLKEKR